MSTIVSKKVKTTEVEVVKKMKDYSSEPVFKKKADRAVEFLKKHGAPKNFTKKK